MEKDPVVSLIQFILICYRMGRNWPLGNKKELKKVGRNWIVQLWLLETESIIEKKTAKKKKNIYTPLNYLVFN